MKLRELVHDFPIFAKYHELVRIVQYLGFPANLISFLTVYRVPLSCCSWNAKGRSTIFTVCKSKECFVVPCAHLPFLSGPLFSVEVPTCSPGAMRRRGWAKTFFSFICEWSSGLNPSPQRSDQWRQISLVVNLFVACHLWNNSFSFINGTFMVPCFSCEAAAHTLLAKKCIVAGKPKYHELVHDTIAN